MEKCDFVLDSINSMYNGIVIINCNSDVVFINEAAYRLFQLKENTVKGKKIDTTLPKAELHLVIEDGHTRLKKQIKVGNSIIMMNQSPIYQNKKIVGAVAECMELGYGDQIFAKEDISQKLFDEYDNAHNLLFDCIVAVNEKGFITMMSDSYADFMEIDNPIEAIGKHCTEVIKNTRIPDVLQSGKLEVGYTFRVKGQDAVVTRMPIFQDGKVKGVIGKILFHDVQELKEIAKQLNLMESRVEYYQNELKRIQGAKYGFENIIGNSQTIKELKGFAMQIAKSRSTVLITGESGTGKELFAHAIHDSSTRSSGPFIRLNCAAIPKDILEAELFGYESGAFTGAKKGGKLGKVEMANKGTLFLDEIGDMPLEMQAKILRVIQEREIQRVGGAKVNEIDVRFIAATNQNLWKMVKKGEFREDLFYRLNVVTMEIPPLREREADSLQLAYFFIDKFNKELRASVSILDDQVINIFKRHSWPGNIRELENVLERAMNTVSESNTIKMEHLPLYLRKLNNVEINPQTSHDYAYATDEEELHYCLQQNIEQAERQIIIKALKRTNGNKVKAADLLEIHRASLYRKIEKYQIEDIDIIPD
ncbi:sigma-54 interaction domain-containing protein [Halalkalibacter nanhaiisediminis]|uniref:Transcriptional regulator with PAS, ATPase and Fis domain n=1 Tax=Halalkalibacter nanhaiisediminis TaxID=688079 RepID=A0A562QCL7_9BACI|nr:sigma 54-interacting transcriptional regulator [Halalkalibacter nanhaiisediminis]TWI54488.1 transcriptional regulator with PAS, ATPase and Fis domain [Halalkalibacter nanhaiisediminis]